MARRARTVEERAAILAEPPGRIAALTEGLTESQLHTSPGPDGWSVNDVLAQLRACHDVFGGNVLRILAEDTPRWKGVNPCAWIKQTDYPRWEFAPAFEAFRRSLSQRSNRQRVAPCGSSPATPNAVWTATR